MSNDQKCFFDGRKAFFDGGIAMDNFNVIYKILKRLEKAMDYDEFDIEQISAESLGINENKWCKIMEMLAQNGYIQGVNVKYSIDGNVLISTSNTRITLKGLEYLNENSFMKKAANIAKGVKEIIM